MTARRSERGASLPETAIVISVLLALMFGIIDFGRAIYTYSFVAQLARQGARWAIVRGANCTAFATACPAQSGTTDVEPFVQSLNVGALKTSNISASLAWTPPNSGVNCSTIDSNQPGCIAVVTVSYPFSFMLPWVPNTTVTMSSTSQMVISN